MGNIMLLVKYSSVLQARCHCTSAVGWYVWKNVEWVVYIESTTVYAAVYKLYM